MRKVGLIVGTVALAASATSVAVMASSVAGAKVVKPPVTVTCTSTNAGGVGSQFGSESNSLLVGCVGSSTKAKVTTTGSVIPDVSAGNATIYWTNNKTTIESFSYAAGGTCPTYLGVSGSAVTVTSTVTGGTAGLTVGQVNHSVTCLYAAGGQDYVQSTGPITF